MKLRITTLLSLSIMLGNAVQAQDGWASLFDGKSLDGWQTYKSKEIPPQWAVEDGTIALTDGGGGDLMTLKEYGDFELELEWKISEGGNSGILFHVRRGNEDCCSYHSGPEIQVLDDQRHPDSFAGKAGTHKAGALYDLVPPNDTSVVKPAGEWNKVRLIVKDGHGESWLNDKKVAEFPTKGPDWESMIANSKFKQWPEFGKADEGYIALQDHGNKVWYRNIRIKEF